ncbi:MAG: tRNA dihydrouridine synthase DusB [Simkaniaceae bacterium]|nr:tRNA dihydrouridine synthase DusB [Simkaniaceae bacterium]
MSYLRKLKLKNLELPSNVWYAPLAGCSDLPFRQMSTLYRPGLMFCEMVKMDALMRNDPGTFRLLDYTHDMHPIGAQIVGSKPHLAGPCAKIIEDLGFDVVDLNCGCPVDKVTKDLSGSGLLKDPQRIGDILTNMVNAVDIPVTVKIRIGWDEESIIAEEITEIAEQAGATAITIHGRTRKQGYKGDADWNPIALCKAKAKSIHVIGNGDIFSGPAAKAIFDQTNCDGVLISRGTLGKPWIYDEIVAHLNGDPPPATDLPATLEAHFNRVKNYQTGRRAVTDMRRIGCWYLKNESKMKTFREKLNKSKDLGEIEELIRSYPWQNATTSS